MAENRLQKGEQLKKELAGEQTLWSYVPYGTKRTMTIICDDDNNYHNIKCMSQASFIRAFKLLQKIGKDIT